MEWRIIALNFIYAALGVILTFLAYRVFDWLTPQVDFPDELKEAWLGYHQTLTPSTTNVQCCRGRHLTIYRIHAIYWLVVSTYLSP